MWPHAGGPHCAPRGSRKAAKEPSEAPWRATGDPPEACRRILPALDPPEANCSIYTCVYKLKMSCVLPALFTFWYCLVAVLQAGLECITSCKQTPSNGHSLHVAM